MSTDPGFDRVERSIRYATICAVVGLTCVLLFLLFGFTPWSVGLGVFLGLPLLAAAVILYVAAVLRDLRRRGVL